MDVQQGADDALRERYTLEALIGEGSFGEVWRARQKATGQAVAVKLIKAAGRQGRRRARFAREARLCAEIHHPHIVRLIDAHHSESNAWLVFELVPGRDLASVLAAEGRLSPAETVRLMGQVLDALAAAHARGIVHRDLKPANIMIVPTGARRNALVLDFGIGALIEEHQGLDLTRITATAEPLGTPAYAAPEQLRGLPPTVRSDIYAWALTFVECLTGQRVVRGRSIADVLMRQVSPSPIELPLELADRPLARLLARALVKDPAARDVTAGELLTELEAVDVSDLQASFAPTAGPAAAPAPTAGTVAGPTLTMGATAATLQTADGAASDALSATLVEEKRPLSLVSCVLRPRATATDAALRAQLAVIAEVGRRFGGRVGASFGDEVHLVFGDPRVAEDDPIRAARAALAIATDSLERRRAAGADDQDPVGVAVSLHCGSLIARAGGERDALVGEAPRIAAAMARQTPTDGVRISADARRRVRRRFALEDRGEDHRVAGAAQPVFALVGECDVAEASTAPLVGRGALLDDLARRWHAAGKGAGQLVVLHGEAGIGKSRLLAAFVEQATDRGPHRRLTLRCSPDGVHAVLGPVLAALHRLVGEPTLGSAPEAVLEGFVERLDLGPSGPALLGPLLDLPWRGETLDVSPARRRALVLDLLVRIFQRLSADRPLVLTVEDVHWADATTLALLAMLAEAAKGSPMLAVLTRRPGGPEVEGAPAVIDVGPLDRPCTGRLAAHIAGVDGLAPAVVDLIFERSDGIPLFVEELVRAMRDAGALADGGLERRSDAFTVPESLEALLVARLHRLGDARETACVAAVLGRELDEALLERVDPRGPLALRDALDAIAAEGILRRTWRIDGTRWSFRHALIRDAAYGSMTDAQRRAVHGRAAAALIEAFPERAAARPEVVARHLAGAGRPQEAVQWSLRAAGGALMRSATTEAIGHADEALTWVERIDDPAARARAELDLNGIICPSLMASSGWTAPRIKAVAERSLALLDAAESGPDLARVIWVLMTYAHLGGRDRATALSLARRLLALAHDESSTVAAHCAVANCLWVDAEYAEATGHFEAALAGYDAARDGHHGLIYGQDTRVWAGGTYAALLYLTGHRARGLALAEEMVAHARTLRHAASEALALLFMAGMCHYEGDHAGARGWRDRVVALADRHGLPAHVTYAAVLGGWADSAPAAAEQAVQGLMFFGCELGLTYYIGVLAEAELEAGAPAAALDRLDDALARAAEMPEPYYTDRLHLVGARAAIAAGADAALVEGHLAALRDLTARFGTAMTRLDGALVGAQWRPDAAHRAELKAALAACPDPGPARRAHAEALLGA